MPVRLKLKHLSGSRANKEDQLALPADREILFGRDPECDVRYEEADDLVSRKHLKIVATNEQPARYMVMDLSSRNGTFVDRQRVFGAVLLSPGGHVQLGAGGPEFEFTVDTPAMRRPPKRHLLKAAILLTLCGAAAGASYLGWNRWPELQAHLHFALKYKASIPGPRSPVFATVEEDWILIDKRTGTPLSRAYIANERLSRASLIPLLEGAPVDLPAFILCGDRRIRPLLVPAGTEHAGEPVHGTIKSKGIIVSDEGAVLTILPKKNAWNTTWPWPRKETAGVLVVAGSSEGAFAIAQVAPLSVFQFPRWIPNQSGYLAEEFSGDAPTRITGRLLTSADLSVRQSAAVQTFGRSMQAKLNISHQNGHTLAIYTPAVDTKIRDIAIPLDRAIAILSEAGHRDALQP